MIILEKPYVSDFLIETIEKNDFKVFDNEIARNYPKIINLLSDSLKDSENELFYTNSENSINKILDNMPNSNLSKMINICKSKSLFRQMLKKVYPDYFFKKIDLNSLFKIDPNEIKYPIILKPDVGFLSFGVYTINNRCEFCEILKKLNSDIEKFKDIFPKSVVDTSNFLLEEKIEGEEYALDAYFDEKGKANILNIFSHPFFDDKDVSDRAYFTSKKIISENLEDFENTLNKINSALNFKNFPFHLELRKNKNNIIPIEINPLRFCGWCITDIAYFAWKINVYEYYFNNKKVDWNNILKEADESIFYFTIGDIPQNTDKSKNIKIDYEKYLKNISNPLTIRKIDPNKNPVFAIVFAKTNTIDEIKNILNLDMTQFIY